jgi:hypothetical protein
LKEPLYARHGQRVLTVGWTLDIAAFAIPALEGAVWVVVFVVPHVGGEGAVWRLLGGRQRRAQQMFGGQSDRAE